MEVKVHVMQQYILLIQTTEWINYKEGLGSPYYDQTQRENNNNLAAVQYSNRKFIERTLKWYIVVVIALKLSECYGDENEK